MSIKDNFTQEEVLEILRKAGGGEQVEPSSDSIIDARPAPYQLTEDVEDNTIIQKVGGKEKFRHKILHPNYGTKDLHPDRFIEEVDESISDTFKARETMSALHQRVEAAGVVSSPQALLDMVLGDDEEPVEPAEALKKMTDEVLCGHSGCGKSFKTPKQLSAHKRAVAHDEYAEDGEKWEKSIPYARLKKKEAKVADESRDTESDTAGTE